MIGHCYDFVEDSLYGFSRDILLLLRQFFVKLHDPRNITLFSLPYIIHTFILLGRFDKSIY